MGRTVRPGLEEKAVVVGEQALFPGGRGRQGAKATSLPHYRGQPTLHHSHVVGPSSKHWGELFHD